MQVVPTRSTIVANAVFKQVWGPDGFHRPTTCRFSYNGHYALLSSSRKPFEGLCDEAMSVGAGCSDILGVMMGAPSTPLYRPNIVPHDPAYIRTTVHLYGSIWAAAQTSDHAAFF